MIVQRCLSALCVAAACEPGSPPPAAAGAPKPEPVATSPAAGEPEAKREGPEFGTIGRADLDGAFGFDWRQTGSSCTAVTPAMLDTFVDKQAVCSKNEAPPFGDTDAAPAAATSYTCKVDRKAEWLIFPSSDACTEQWETMNANGP